MNKLDLDLPTKNEMLSLINAGVIIKNSDYAKLTMNDVNENTIWLRNGKSISYYEDDTFSINNQSKERTNVSIMPVIRDKSIVNDALAFYVINNNNEIHLNIHFPLFSPSKQVQEKLENAFNNHDFEYTYRVYMGEDEIFYKGKTYIRVLNRIKSLYTWIEVEDIPWIISPKLKLLISKYPIIGNIPFSNKTNNMSVNYALELISTGFEKNSHYNRDIDIMIYKYKRKLVADDIAIQMLMSKENLKLSDLELDSESQLVLRR